MTCFTCIGPQCEDTCCNGWNIGLYEKDYKTLADLFGKDPEQRRIFKDAVEKHKSPKGEEYGRLKHGECGRCPFMLQDGWCRVHRDFGEAALPAVCATFPRQILHAEESRVVGNLACPEVVRLIVDDEQALSFVPIEPSTLPPKHETAPLERLLPTDYGSGYQRVTDKVAAILADTKRGLGERLFLSAHFSDHLASFYHRHCEEPLPRLERALKRYTDEARLNRFAKPFHEAEKVNPQVLLLFLIGPMARAVETRRPRYMKLIERVWANITAESATFPDNPGQALAHLKAEQISEPYYTRWARVPEAERRHLERVLGRLVLNEWINTPFINYDQVMIPIQQLILMAVICQVLFVLHADLDGFIENAAHLDQAHQVMVAVVQNYVRNYGHQHQLVEATRKGLLDLGLNTPNDLAPVLKIWQV